MFHEKCSAKVEDLISFVSSWLVVNWMFFCLIWSHLFKSKLPVALIKKRQCLRFYRAYGWHSDETFLDTIENRLSFSEKKSMIGENQKLRHLKINNFNRLWIISKFELVWEQMKRQTFCKLPSMPMMTSLANQSQLLTTFNKVPSGNLFCLWNSSTHWLTLFGCSQQKAEIISTSVLKLIHRKFPIDW